RVYLYRRVTRGKEEKGRLRERFGIASAPRPAGPLVWLHAASVGESLSLLPLLEALRQREPALNVLVTSGTVTSARLLQTRMPEGVIHQYNPIDRAAWVRRFLDHWRPDLALYVESELWPNLLGMTQARGIPTGLLNARMSETSFRNWRRMPAFIQRLMAGFHFCLAQNPTQADRMAQLGARNPRPLGNLKCAAKPLVVDPDTLAELRRASADRPCWLAASTHDGEEATAAQVHDALRARHPGLLTVIAPRHPERATEIGALLDRRGLSWAQRSAGALPTAGTQVYLADTLGEMGLLLRVAPMALIGGSLVPHGGHNPIEAAQLEAAILYGPHMSNFRDITRQLEAAGGALPVADTAELTAALGALLADPARPAALIGAAGAVVARNRDIVERAHALLAPLLAPAGAQPTQGRPGSGRTGEQGSAVDGTRGASP
ncbi:MAG TPA: 3-deoxy-D-manno-octulosonic acid transferase, partial [Pseudohaliea sp.]|nr:3-deoxy-D-manno-octulosonic acid transferase [Pseudohaliea sp.]